MRMVGVVVGTVYSTGRPQERQSRWTVALTVNTAYHVLSSTYCSFRRSSFRTYSGEGVASELIFQFDRTVLLYVPTNNEEIVNCYELYST